MVDRRAFLVTVGAGIATASRVGEAQQAGRMYRVAVLHLTSPTPPVDGFRKTMRDLGWLEGQTLLIDYRGADGKAERLDQLAGEIVASRPDVIVTGTSGAAVAAKRATATIPIVMAVSVDPVGLGVVQSLARPGRNITGQAILSPELSVKRLELLKRDPPRCLPCGDLLERRLGQTGGGTSSRSESHCCAGAGHPPARSGGSRRRRARRRIFRRRERPGLLQS
jgi:putative ABC transport system substrate-binding protein